jgi:hypothetical protein
MFASRWFGNCFVRTKEAAIEAAVDFTSRAVSSDPGKVLE